MEFSYSQTENFEMEKLSSDTGYFKKPVEINRGFEVLEDWMVEAYINLKPKVLESVQVLIINRAVVASAQGSRPNSIAVFLILVLVCGGDRKDKQLLWPKSCLQLSTKKGRYKSNSFYTYNF